MNRIGQPDPQGRVLVVEDDPDAARFVVSGCAAGAALTSSTRPTRPPR
jgi:hypothetical protein